MSQQELVKAVAMLRDETNGVRCFRNLQASLVQTMKRSGKGIPLSQLEWDLLESLDWSWSLEDILAEADVMAKLPAASEEQWNAYLESAIGKLKIYWDKKIGGSSAGGDSSVGGDRYSYWA